MYMEIEAPTHIARNKWDSCDELSSKTRRPYVTELSEEQAEWESRKYTHFFIVMTREPDDFDFWNSLVSSLKNWNREADV